MKKRKELTCTCKGKRKEKADNERMKYGTSNCDGYSFNYSQAIQMSNALYQYIADAYELIIRDDWDIIEKHANSIREYSEADSWDELSTDKKIKQEYKNKDKKFKQAMKWLADNWQSLW